MAYVDATDRWHEPCLTLLLEHRGPLLVPALVIAEVAHFISRLGTDAELGFLADLTDGALEPVPVDPMDWPRIVELMWRYRDLPLGTVDASVVALAERLRITQIATLDRKHFSVVQPLHVDAFELLP